MKKPDVVIVGAGVIGLSSARELAQRGYQVMVVDKQEVGRGASRAAGGILSALRPWTAPPAVDTLAAESRAMYSSWFGELHQDTGIDPEFRRCGMVVHGADHLIPARQWASNHDVPLSEVGADDLPAAYRGVIEVTRSVLLQGIGQVRNPQLMRALHADVIRRGVTVVTGIEVLGMVTDGDRVGGIRTNRGQICAGQVVVCAGAWSSRIQGAGITTIRPVRGQMIWYQAPRIPDLPIVDDGEHYAVRRGDGVTLVGSTVEDVGFDLGITDNALIKLRKKASKLMRDLKACEVRGQWSGLRPAGPVDGPIIGYHPVLRGLLLNTGHYRTGVTLAPASAKHLANLMEHGVSAKIGPKQRLSPVF